MMTEQTVRPAFHASIPAGEPRHSSWLPGLHGERVLPISRRADPTRWHRYYGAAEKVRWLFTHILGNDPVPPGAPREVTAKLRRDYPRFDLLCAVVERMSGYTLEVVPGAAHAPGLCALDVAPEVLESAESLHAFLRSQQAYVQTRDDSQSPPWVIPTDRGGDLFYADQLAAAVPSDYVARDFVSSSDWHPWEFSTSTGAVVSGRTNAQLFREVLRRGIVTRAAWVYRQPLPPCAADDLPGFTADTLLSLDDTGHSRVRLLRTLDVRRRFEQSTQFSKTLAIQVHLPQALALEIDALASPRGAAHPTKALAADRADVCVS